MKKIMKMLSESPIMYFSDLFIEIMVISWLIAIIVVTVFAIYATVAINDTSVWGCLVELVSVPLTAGGAIWMIKNSVQHAILNKQGKKVEYDFPKVNAEGEDDGAEKIFKLGDEE